MSNIEDYITWRGDLSFKRAHLNEVDNLILAELAYLEFDDCFYRGITIKEVITNYLKKNSETEILKKFPLSQNPLSFYKKLANSIRFGSLKIVNYENNISNELEEQFSAMLIELNYFTAFVAFRGTDSSLVGWKEDFNMSFMLPVPSQEAALNFVNKSINFKYQNIYLSGHSKGGNLAVYSGVLAKKSIKKKIVKIYNNDGPGFDENFITRKEYLEMLDKIITIVPESSIIGMLLEHKEKYKVVKSTAYGLWQHDALSWIVEHDHFEISHLDENTIKINQAISQWLKKISKEEREMFVNTVYDILKNNNILTVEDLINLKTYKLTLILKSFLMLDSDIKKMVFKFVKDLFAEAKDNFENKHFIEAIKGIK